MYWCGDLVGEEFKCVGNECLPIKPNIDLDPPEGLSRYYFEMNLLRDVGVHLQLSTQHVPQQPSADKQQSVIKKRCFTCNKSIPLSEMRAHVGIHILRNDLLGPNVCGFCGRDTCANKCKSNSKKGGIPVFTFDKSDCEYFFAIGRSKVFNKRSNICSNRFDQCPVHGCITEIWKYNFQDHIQEKHPGVEANEYPLFTIAEEERQFLLNKKKKNK